MASVSLELICNTVVLKAFFKELFEYNHQTNQKLAELFSSQSDMTSRNAIRLFCHILNAHQIWNNRVDSRQTLFGIWDMHETSSLKTIDLSNFQHTLNAIDTIDPGKKYHYTNSRGQAFSNTGRDIFFHIINHSTYHRAQIATEFKQAGLEPLPTDYIFFKR